MIHKNSDDITRPTKKNSAISYLKDEKKVKENKNEKKRKQNFIQSI